MWIKRRTLPDNSSASSIGILELVFDILSVNFRICRKSEKNILYTTCKVIAVASSDLTHRIVYIPACNGLI